MVLSNDRYISKFILLSLDKYIIIRYSFIQFYPLKLKTLKKGDKMAKVIAYMRVSTDKQKNDNQEEKIKKYAKANNIKINEWVYMSISSTAKEAKAKVLEIIDRLEKGDTLITTELSRLGRKAQELADNRKKLMDKEVTVIFTNQTYLNTNGNKALDTLIFNIVAYMAEQERENISERTIQALDAKRAKAKEQGIKLKLGHNKNFLKSRYDDFEEAIYNFKEVNKLSFQKICDMLDADGSKGFKAQSLRNFFLARYELEPHFQTWQRTRKYQKHLDELAG